MIANADRKILVMWLIAIGLISARELRATDLPRPSAYVGSAIVYGMAAVLAEVAPDVAVLATVGWTLAIAYQVVGDRGRGKSSSGPSRTVGGRAPGPRLKGVAA